MSKLPKVRPCFLEAGLPCSSLSAECQRDNNARQRPPQNRLHIWWARRPPTISRAAILAALLPHDLQLPEDVLPPMVEEPSERDLESLPRKLLAHREFFERLLTGMGPTPPLSPEHSRFLRAMGIAGDASRAYRRMALREEYSRGSDPIVLPMEWTYRHGPAFEISPSEPLLRCLAEAMGTVLCTRENEPVVLLDSMAGGGSIPLEGVRYGLKVFANELNPVSSLVLKATLEYPTRFGRSLLPALRRYVSSVDRAVRERLIRCFYTEPAQEWWPHESERAAREFRAKTIVRRGPADREPSKNCNLWLRTVPCSRCGLNIPLSTNFYLVNKKGKPSAALAAFPEVPELERGNDCTFRVVGRAEWKDCAWPRPGFAGWHPRDTPTYKDGRAHCPRCGQVMDGDEVKAVARSRPGGLRSQMYAVCSQVPVRLTYRKGEAKVRYLWRFRSPHQADLDAVRAAEAELNRLLPPWEAQGLVPDEEVPEYMEDKRPREYGMTRWRDLFLPRQLLTNMVILEEILAAQKQARRELPEAEAEAVSVYLAFILSKVVNYNSVNTFWDYTRNKGAQTFSRHDFAFRAAFTEFEGARETVMWGASQVLNAYEDLARLIHGEAAERSHGVIVPTVTCEDAAAFSMAEAGTVHLICLDPPYYNNVQYGELSNFFYVWLKRALGDWPGLAHLFREPLVETNREAVANAARWQGEAERDKVAWQGRYDEAFAGLRAQRVKASQAKLRAAEAAGPKPLSARDRADRFYEDKMAAIFRRSRRLLRPTGRMVVMFNHKQTWAWRSLGMALIRAGFEVRSSVPIHTEAESSLNIRGLDAARSTVLLLCLPREEAEQPVGNWGAVQSQVARLARGASEYFQGQGLSGTDLYLSALGPALGEVGRNWPVTDFGGRAIDLHEALEEAYRAVGRWRLQRILDDLTERADFSDTSAGFSAEAVDRGTQTLWLWLDTFQGERAQSDDVRKLAKSLGVSTDDFKNLGLLEKEKDLFVLRPPQGVDLRLLSRRLQGVKVGRGDREADVWEERSFPDFVGAAVWNAISLMEGTDQGPRGPEAVRRWLDGSGHGAQREFKGAFAVTLSLVERAFQGRPERDPWAEALRQARRAWDLLLKGWRAP